MKKINELFEKIGFDGCKHIILSAIIMTLLQLITPNIVAALVTLGIGWIKEMYDQRGHGQVQIKDILCNILGIIIGYF